LVGFFRECGLVVSEGDCYMLVKAFDKGGTGALSMGDVMLILAPRSYDVKRNMRGCQKYFQYGAPRITLSPDIEFAVMNVFQMEIEMLKKAEMTKQTLMTQFDFSVLNIFKFID
jgi:hypothetical protein